MSEPADDGEPTESELAKISADLVAFYRALAPSAKADYEALAALDRAHGEDVRGQGR